MSEPLINCISCMKDECENCLHPDSCLCSVATNHNENLKPVETSYGVWTNEDRQKIQETLQQAWQSLIIIFLI